jgi:2-polyprenyl-3-methyl-5-hydroxy-6-metoxy-1,4-benzoquinol methylase
MHHLDLTEITDNGERVTHLYPNTSYYAHLSLYHFARSFAHHRTVLDAGCGAGYGTHYLAESGAAFVWGIDVSQKTIEFNQYHFQRQNLSYKTMDLQSIQGFAPQTFDLIFTSNTLEHIYDLRPFFHSVHQLLKPDGILIVAVPPIANEAARQANLANPYHLNIWSPHQWHYVLNHYFATVECYRHHYEKPGVPLTAGDTPDTCVLRPEDFLFLPISIEELNRIGALTAIFVAYNQRATEELPAITTPVTMIDTSFTRLPPSLTELSNIPNSHVPPHSLLPSSEIRPWPPTASLAQKTLLSLKHRGLRATIQEIYAYCRWKQGSASNR